jgi:hypothetical protein
LVTFFRPDGVGMLRVFTQEVSDFPVGGAIPRVFIPLRPQEHTYGTSYSRTWTVPCRRHKVIVRYSCALSNANHERSEVDAIVQSLSDNESNEP